MSRPPVDDARLELLLQSGIEPDELRIYLESLLGRENVELTEIDLPGAAGIRDESGAPAPPSSGGSAGAAPMTGAGAAARSEAVAVAGVPPSPGIDAAIEGDVQRLGEILVERQGVAPEVIRRTLSEQKPLGERLVASGAVAPEQVEAALGEQARQREAVERRVRGEMSTNIRVNSLKLDKLVNLIGELVTVQERLSQVAGLVRGAPPDQLAPILSAFDLGGISEEVSRLTGGLRDNALSIRMMPIEATFSKFRRLVHDLASTLGKEIDLVMHGQETEIDKTVIDRLDEPLIHLVRNCADHGLESPEIRVATGKPRHGTITLSAEHVGGNVVIRVGDDGRGLERQAIVARAVEKGLIAPNAELSDREVFNLVFLPGFSTAEKVTNLSGRGVGMNVVKKTIEDLRGTVEIHSVAGKGSRFDITLPLTLAIIDGLLVGIGGQNFIIPLSVVEECIELRADQRDPLIDKNLVTVRSQLVPFVPLRERFSIDGSAPPIQQVVITRQRGERLGLLVDRVVGEHKTVIKPLGRMYQRVPEFSGATILGDGTIAIILDVGRIAAGVAVGALAGVGSRAVN